MIEETRPAPGTMIERIRQEAPEEPRNGRGRGRLKIFLGYCAGVGKTYRMLQEAALSKMNGIDAVIGIAETHGRKETEALLDGLEIIPRKTIDYSGLKLAEFDLDAVFSRKPAIVIVDELAHTNAAGSRHAKRFQDVEELLNAGIDVFTTLNIQHIESLNDAIRQISGIKVGERVPDKIIEIGEVELVDLIPEKLLERLRDGKVYIPQKAEQAMRQFFRRGNLLALRELSLKYTARQVDEDVRDYMEKNAVAGPWPVGSRIMTAIGPALSSERLIRFTHRMAQDLDAEWFAVHVQSPQKIEMNDKDRIQFDKNIRLAEEFGADVILLSGASVAEEILEFARSKNVTLIVSGSSKRTWLERLIKGDILDTLIKKSGQISVLITDSGKEPEPEKKYTPLSRARLEPFVKAFLVVAAAAAFTLLFRAKLNPLNTAMLLLLPAIASGIFWGVWAGLFASILAISSFDFFFIPPFLTFRVSDLRYLPVFAVFIFVSSLISFLAESLRQEAESSRHRERFVYSLYSFTKAMMAASDLEDILNRAVKTISEAFESNTVILLPGATGSLQTAAKDSESVRLSEMEQAVAAWVMNNGRPAGKSTNTLSAVPWYFLPLRIQDTTTGVVGLKSLDPSRFLTPGQDQLFESFAGVVTLAIMKSAK